MHPLTSTTVPQGNYSVKSEFHRSICVNAGETRSLGPDRFFETVQSVLGSVYPATRSSHGGIDDATAGFLLSLIETHKPVNLVEVGVASGGSSCLMLSLLERMESRARLTSFDPGVTVCEHPSLPIGHLVKELFLAGTPSWRLYTEAMSADIAGRISGHRISFSSTRTTNIQRPSLSLPIMPASLALRLPACSVLQPTNDLQIC